LSYIKGPYLQGGDKDKNLKEMELKRILKVKTIRSWIKLIERNRSHWVVAK